MTNGEIIKLFFPDIEISQTPFNKQHGTLFIKFKGNEYDNCVSEKWWNRCYNIDVVVENEIENMWKAEIE